MRIPSLATATRDYDRAIEGGTFDHLRAHELTRLYLGMGEAVWAWQRARRLIGQPPWRAAASLSEAGERENAEMLMLQDIPTWEGALKALDAETARAVRYGLPVPLPLAVPAPVAAALAAHRASVLERALRRRGRSDGGGGPDLVPPDPGAGPAIPGRGI